MRPTNRKKALESVPSQNNFLKIGFPLILTDRKNVIFKKNGFILISIIVSTSGNESCKILFCLAEIAFFSIIVFFLLVATIIEIIRKPIFTENFIFLASEKLFFLLIRYSREISCLIEIVLFYSKLCWRFWSDCNWTRTQNHLICKRTLNHSAKLAKWLSCVVSTYQYGLFDCMFLSWHVRFS